MDTLISKEHAIVVALRRNFGQTAAIAAGIDYANGDIICLLDADLQNDPDDIPMMLGKIHEGYDVVSGWRINRQDKFVTRTLPSRAANFLISEVTGVHLHDYGCTLKAYRREVLTGFRLYGEMHRFIPAYAYSVGAKITEVPVKHHPRRFGKTKYGLNRTIKVILDLFTVKFLISYSNKPIYLFGGTGVILILISLLGMNPTAAFPIMMGSCAFLMPVGSARFIRHRAYALRTAIGLTLGGIPAVLIAAYVVTSLPLYMVRWLVIVVVIYTAVMMLRSAAAEKRRAVVRPAETEAESA